MRIERKDQKIVNKKRKLENSGGGYLGGSSGATGGLASSLAFTGTQGLNLLNPSAATERAQRTTESGGYFSQTGTFSSVRKGT